MVFSPDGNTLAVGSGYNTTVFLWNVNTGKQLHTFIGNTKVSTGTAPSISFSPDGEILASSSLGYVDGEKKASVILWDVNTGDQLRELIGHTGRVESISFSPDGPTLATGGWDEIRFWDVNTGETLQTLTRHAHKVSSISFSPDGSMLATGSRDGAVLLWELTPFSPETERITADINDDGTVNIQDLVIVANAFGKAEPDLNGDGVVNIQDLVIVANAF